MLFGALLTSADYFADSISGNDGNSGQQSSGVPSPLATIAAAVAKGGSAIALKAGSTFREKLNLNANAKHVLAYGSGDAPILTVFDVINPASWSLAGGQTRTYQTTVSHTITEAGTAYAYVLEDGAIVTRRASIAATEANPGSFYCPHDAGMSTHNPYTLYYHPTGSGNPANNGKVVEANARDHAIEDVSNSNSRFEGLHLRGCGVDDGCVDGGCACTCAYLYRIGVSYGCWRQKEDSYDDRPAYLCLCHTYYS